MGVENGDGRPRGEQLSAPDAKRGGVRFHFRALGPIKEAELELSGLTVLAGGNNTGKTWLSTALYGYLTHWRQWDALFREFTENPELADAVRFLKQAARRGSSLRSVSRAEFHRERQILIDGMSAAFSRGALDSVFGAPSGTLVGASVRVELDPPSRPLLTQGLSLGDGTRFVIRQEDDGVSLERVEDVRIEDEEPGPGDSEALPGRTRQVLEGLMRLYTVFALPELNVWVPGIPAEAAGLVLFHRELDRNKNRIVETLQRSGVAEPRSALEAFLQRRATRTSVLVGAFIDLAREMPVEKDLIDRVLRKRIERMMGGRYESDGHSIFFVSAKDSKDPFRIPLDLASTSVRSLAGLYYVETGGGFHDDLVMVDEPESGLDTRNQIQLARTLARLVRRGTRVLLATHSDYLIKELNNLIMLSQDFQGKGVLIERLGYAPDDFLPREAVRAFVAENGGLTRCEVDAYGMNMPVFDETIDSINSAANALAARIAR